MLMDISRFVSAMFFSKIHKDYCLLEIPHLLPFEPCYVRTSKIPIFFDFQLSRLSFRWDQ